MGIFSKPEVIFLKETSDAKDYLVKLEELLQKASGDTAEKIKKEIAITKAGILGEDNILFELKNSGMDLVVLQDILIETDGLSAQIDFYVITSKLNFIIECKNLYGNIEINSKGDFVRTFEYNGKKYKEGIYSPITQNERHMTVLKAKKKEDANFITKMAIEKWHGNSNIPLVVLANPKTVVNDRYATKDVKQKVIRADQLIATIKRINSESKEPTYSKKELLEAGERMLKRNSSNRKDYLEKFEALVNETKTNEENKENTLDNSVADNTEKICPKCGKPLILREASKGQYAGNKFWGCSGFPKCRYIENI